MLRTISYRVSDLSGFPVDPDRFYELDYRETLRPMVDAILDHEAPVRADILAQRIARAHGWLRTGARIRERIDLHLRTADTTAGSSGVFVWKRGSVTDLMPYRTPYDAGSWRAVAEVPLAELAAVAVANRAILDQPDPALELARLPGMERLAAVSRARLGEAIERARAQPADELT